MKFIGLLTVLLLSFNGLTQTQKKELKIRTAEFKVSTECHHCKTKIEDEINYLKGVVYVNVAFEKQAMKVKYNSKKTNETTIKQAVASLGFDCDDVQANQKAKNNLGHVCADHKGCGSSCGHH